MAKTNCSTIYVSNEIDLEVGDHVYQWRKWMGLPFQHHGIVRKVYMDWTTRRKVYAIFDTYAENNTWDTCWQKVEYGVSLNTLQTNPQGTCSSAKPDPVFMVLARCRFLASHPELLREFHLIYSNCESVSVWCKTGKWQCHQAASGRKQQYKFSSLGVDLGGPAIYSTVPAAILSLWLGYNTSLPLELLEDAAKSGNTENLQKAANAKPVAALAIVAAANAAVRGIGSVREVAKMKLEWNKINRELDAAFDECCQNCICKR